jgi:hypothetical protein
LLLPVKCLKVQQRKYIIIFLIYCYPILRYDNREGLCLDVILDSYCAGPKVVELMSGVDLHMLAALIGVCVVLRLNGCPRKSVCFFSFLFLYQ